MTVQRISGGTLFAISYDDNDAGDQILAGAIAIRQTGGNPGFPEVGGGGPVVPYYDLITGGGLFAIANRDAVKFNTILAGGISLNGKGTAETHASPETPFYPKIIEY